MNRLFVLVALLASAFGAQAQENTNQNPFRQLGQELPTPNTYRTASGDKGHEYWQQQADYDMKIRLDDETQKIYGEETVTYINNSPDDLDYLWVQLDQNVRAKESDRYKIQQQTLDNRMTFDAVRSLEPWFDGGFKIDHVKDAGGKDLPYTINNTMMRIDLPSTLKAGGKVSFNIKWWYNINDRMQIGGRSGYEYFEEDGNFLYTIAQFYPRMAVYCDNYGWQHKQFLGRGEFTLNFGDYKVAITVPSDHIVGSTGELTNASKVLSATQRKRFASAKNADSPVMIVTEEEAREAEKGKQKGQKTWIFEAENVRDFAFASSRKFIWDAMGVDVGDKRPLAMSYYPKEGNPLWEQYSTKAVAHTLRSYSAHTIDYPYPVAISVHSKWIGMEYPMICFNGGRPEADGTYTERTKYGMISVIIHEVGHNFFPMIINSDERQWTWMDEGLNTFCQYLAEQEWDRNYPSRRGPARNITNYMKGDKSNISPIMTNSESVYQFGNNAYGKPATALNILRETVMGRELFDFAFKEYCERWAFHHPTPADFFRSMEDASSVDLDWFWRGWFYTNDHCDMAIDGVKWYQPNSQDPDEEADFRRDRDANIPADVTDERNEGRGTYLEQDPTLHDYYTQRDKYEVLKLDKDEYNEMLDGMDAEDRGMLADGKNYYQVDIRRIGGLVMPVIVELELENGERIRHHVPAEIWKMDDEVVSKVFVTPMPAVRIVLDPNLETADTDNTNNAWPPRPEPSRFELYKERQGRRGGGGGENPMQRAIRSGELKK